MHWVGYDQVFKLGSRTQEINVNQFSNYKELRQEIACMFSLDVIPDPDDEWQLMYINNEEDDESVVVGDCPWEYVTLLF